MKLDELDLHITNRCNMRCIHCCYSSGEKEMTEMSYKQIIKLLIEAKNLGVEHVDIFGGEPTIRDDLIDILNATKDLGIKTELLTNGLMRKEREIELLESGVDSIGVSLDGISEEVYKKIRKVNGAGRVIEFAKRCVNKGIYTKINTVLFKSNINEIKNIVQLSNSIGADEQRIYYFTPVGRGAKCLDEWVNPEEWIKYIIKELVPLELKTKLLLESPFIKRKNPSININNFGCRAMNVKNYAQIMSDGSVYPCAILTSSHPSLGNVLDKSLEEIMRDENLEKYHLNRERCVGYDKLVELKEYKKLSDDKEYALLCPCVKFPVRAFGK